MFGITLKNKQKSKKIKKNEFDIQKISTHKNIHHNKNSFNASFEASEGRKIVAEVLERRKNTNPEFVKGWLQEALKTADTNIDAARKGSESRAVMHDSKRSTERFGMESDSGSAADISIIEGGEKTYEIQSKVSNAGEKAYKYLDRLKYKGMKKLINKDIEKDVLNIAKGKDNEEIASNTSSSVEYTDKKGKKINSGKGYTEKTLKNTKKVKIISQGKEVKETLTSSTRAGVETGIITLGTSIIDDIVEKRELNLKEALNKATTAGGSSMKMTLIRDVVVNKYKLTTIKGFNRFITTLGLVNDVNELLAKKRNGLSEETLTEEVEILIAKVTKNALVVMAHAIPGSGTAASVFIDYICSKMIQKVFYSQASLHLRQLRVVNDNNDKILAEMKDEIKKIETKLASFLLAVEERCREREAVVLSLEKESKEKDIQKASYILTGKKIANTTDEEIKSLFSEEGLTI